MNSKKFRDTHRRFDTLHKWCQEWPIMSGITLTRIGLQLVGRCVPVPIYYLGWLKLVSDNILKTGWSHKDGCVPLTFTSPSLQLVILYYPLVQDPSFAGRVPGRSKQGRGKRGRVARVEREERRGAGLGGSREAQRALGVGRCAHTPPGWRRRRSARARWAAGVTFEDLRSGTRGRAACGARGWQQPSCWQQHRVW